jgi:hypothetical protein
MQGNAAVKPIFNQWFQPFHDLGAGTLSLQNTGGTDHLSFDAIGLPAFQFIRTQWVRIPDTSQQYGYL